MSKCKHNKDLSQAVLTLKEFCLELSKLNIEVFDNRGEIKDLTASINKAADKTKKLFERFVTLREELEELLQKLRKGEFDNHSIGQLTNLLTRYLDKEGRRNFTFVVEEPPLDD